MNINKTLEWRYSTKKFDPNKQISNEDQETIVNLLQMCPSGTNIQPWHFIIANTTSGKERIAVGSSGQFSFMRSKIMDASLCILVCAKTQIEKDYLDALLKGEDQAGRYSSEEQKKQLNQARTSAIKIYNSTGDLQTWIQMQVYLNVGFFLMGTATMGIDSLAMESLDLESLEKEFDLPSQKLKALAVISLGYRASDDVNDPNVRPKYRWEKEKIISYA